MRQLRIVGVVSLVAGSLALQAQVGAQTTRAAEMQFKAAQYKQEVQGDLKGAIEEYKKVAQGPDRTLAARALFAIGVSYQTLGTGDAQAVFAQIVREFTEPKDVVTAARAKLAASAPGRVQADATAPRMVLAVDRANILDVSADGTVAVGMSPVGRQPQVTLWNLSSGESRVLVPIAESGGRAEMPRLAPNGRYVAYRWTETIGGKPVISLRVIAIEPAAKTRPVPDPEGTGMSGPLSWSPDGRSLLVLGQHEGGTRSLNWISVADGSVRRIKSFEAWQQPGGVAVSSDGWIAYAAAPRQGDTEARHIFVVDGAGKNESAVVNTAGFNRNPVWTPDGAHLVFVSDRLGAPALWSVGVRDGRPAGDPSRLLSGTMVPLGVTRSGQLYYRTSNMSDFNQVGFVAEHEAGAARIIKTFIGEGISWSPDGKSLAYIRNTGAPPAVMIREIQTGEERAYPIARLGLQQARWLPDSSGVVVFVRGDSDAQGGFMYSLDLRSGEYKKLVASPAGRSGVVAISPDGKSLYVGEEGANAREIFCVDLASGSERSIGTLPSGGGTPGLSISPDGTSLVAQTWADQPKRLGRLIIVKTDGSGTRELLSSFPADRTLSVVRWTADGRHILYFTTAENGDWRLMRISPTGGQPEFAGLDSTKLTGTVRIPPPGPFSPLSMDASPDGTQIVFAFRPALHTELWTLDNVLSVVGSRQ